MPSYSRDYLDHLKASNPPEELADALNLPLKGGRAQCVFHGGDHYNLSFKGPVARCFACGGTFDAIALVRRALAGWGQADAPFDDAVRWLAARTAGLPDPHADTLSPRPYRVAALTSRRYKAPPPDVIHLLDLATALLEEQLWRWDGQDAEIPGHPLALLRRRLKSDAVIRRDRLGYSPGPDFLPERLPPDLHGLAARYGLIAGGRDRLARRIAIPEIRLLDHDGQQHVVSLQARTVVDPPVWRGDKYLYLAGVPRPLLGLQRARGKSPYVVVTEGYFKSRAAERWGYPSVALGSADGSAEIVAELRGLFRHAPDVTLLFVPDRDGTPWWRDQQGRLHGPGAGAQGAARVIRKLRLDPLQRVLVIRIPPQYKGLDDLDDARPDAREVFDARVAAAARVAQRLRRRGVHRHMPEPARVRNRADERWRQAMARAAVSRWA